MKRINYVLVFAFILIVSTFNAFAQSSINAIFTLDKLDTENYYYGKLNDTLYYVKFDIVSKDYAEGSYFVADHTVFAELKPFQVTRKEKYILKLDDKTIQVKQDFVLGNKRIVGKYATNNKLCKIFRNYDWSDYVEFKRQVQTDIKTFPRRYKEKVFEEVIVKSDVVYGKAEGYWDSYPLEDESYMEILQNGVLSTISKKNLNLKMDIYLPKGDTIEKRPLIMLMHGGGFYIGDKQTKAMVQWCKYFAQLGYVTASVNYRLGFKPIGPSIQRAGYRGLQDAHAAMRFLVAKASDYGIDTDRIIVGGTSAGGVTALNLTYLRNKNRPEATRGSLSYSDQGDIEKSGNSYKNKFDIKAVINMWGAINDLDILKNSDAAIISFHGDADDIVPIDHNYPFQDIKGNFSKVVLEKMYGSLPIHIEAKKLGRREELHIIESAGHSPHVDVDDNLNEIFDFITENVREFIYEEVVPEICVIESKPLTPFPRAMAFYQTSCEDYKEIYWQIDGGIITGRKDNAVRVVWFDTASKHKLILSGCYADGAGFYDVYEF